MSTCPVESFHEVGQVNWHRDDRGRIARSVKVAGRQFGRCTSTTVRQQFGPGGRGGDILGDFSTGYKPNARHRFLNRESV
jgi:hypothetical protein